MRVPFLPLSVAAICTATAPALAEIPLPPTALLSTEVGYSPVESDASDRINLAGKLGMLTQQVAAASCALTSDTVVEESHDVLVRAAAEFEQIVAALRHGDLSLHILRPEEDRRLLRDLDALWEEWVPVHDAVAAIMIDSHDVESSHIIDDHNLALLERAEILMSDVSGRYSHPYELSQVDAIMIKLAGRQRMLTQKMAKDACEIWTHYHEEEAVEDLIVTKTIFEDSMTALRDGMPEMGLPAAPTPAIADDLDRILTRWEVVSANLDILIETRDLDQAGRDEVFHDLELELVDIDKLVADYADYAERHH